MSVRSAAINLGLRGAGLLYSQRLRRHPELRDMLDGLHSRSAAVSTADAIALYETVLTRRPAVILDLGAGTSSAVFALAARVAGYRPRIIAVEESDEWLSHHRDTLPRDLQDDIEFLRLDVGTSGTNGTQAARYVGIPRLSYDMIHIDGPRLAPYGVQVSDDVLDLLPVLARRCAMTFDGREASARFCAPPLKAAGFTGRRHRYTLSHVFERKTQCPD